MVDRLGPGGMSCWRRDAIAACLAAIVGSLGPVAPAWADSAVLQLKALQATRQRPLFAPTRRPPPESVATPETEASAAPPAVSPPTVQVTGIIIGGGKQMALVKRAQDPNAIRVTVGSDIDGWTVSAVLVRGIVLKRDAQTVTVDLPESGKPPEPAKD